MTSHRTEQLERLKALDDLVADQQRLLDRSLITVSSGSFGVSVLFAQSIAPDPSVRWLLALAWCAFGASIVATLLSFRAAANAAELAAEEERASMASDAPLSPLVIKRIGKDVDGWNCLAIGTFITGAILLTVFASINLLS